MPHVVPHGLPLQKSASVVAAGVVARAVVAIVRVDIVAGQKVRSQRTHIRHMECVHAVSHALNWNNYLAVLQTTEYGQSTTGTILLVVVVHTNTPVHVAYLVSMLHLQVHYIARRGR